MVIFHICFQCSKFSKFLNFDSYFLKVWAILTLWIWFFLRLSLMHFSLSIKSSFDWISKDWCWLSFCEFWLHGLESFFIPNDNGSFVIEVAVVVLMIGCNGISSKAGDATKNSFCRNLHNLIRTFSILYPHPFDAFFIDLKYFFCKKDWNNCTQFEPEILDEL